MKLTAQPVKAFIIEDLGFFVVESKWNGMLSLRNVANGELLIVAEPLPIAEIFAEIMDKTIQLDVVKCSPSIIEKKVENES